MPVFFIERNALQGNTVSITGPLARHLSGSLRVRPGEMIWLGETGGPRFHVRVTAAGRARLTALIISEQAPPPVQGPRITLGLALVKAVRMDWAIQKAAELGAARVVPLITTRSVIRSRSDRADHQTGRWQSIALEAAQQSMRWDVPVVTAPAPFASWCADAGRDECRLICWEGHGAKSLRSRLQGRPGPSAVTVAIGPEGGFESSEIDHAARNGFEAVSLGPRILRTDGAVAAVLAVLQYEWGDLA
jgi:16S rRNA (uracil1498-N3)-methyltransferase